MNLRIKTLHLETTKHFDIIQTKIPLVKWIT